MTAQPPSPLTRDIAAALDWWREAGVDAAFADDPRAWLAEVDDDAPASSIFVAAEPEPALPPEPKIGGPRETWPRDLGEFAAWWMNEPTLDSGGLFPCIPPRGPAKPELMVLVEMPEEGDRDTLLSGRQGALLQGFLTAAGLAADQVYVATAVRRHTALADWSELLRQGLGEIVRHHVALAGSRRVLLLGRNILPLCGHDPAQGAQTLRFLNHEGGRVAAMAETGLDRLLDKAELRARLWRRWLDWSGGDAREDGG